MRKRGRTIEVEEDLYVSMSEWAQFRGMKLRPLVREILCEWSQAEWARAAGLAEGEVSEVGPIPPESGVESLAEKNAKIQEIMGKMPRGIRS